MTKTQTARVAALHVGKPQTLGADSFSDKPWTTGFFKAPIEGEVWLHRPSFDGLCAALSGDGQADLMNHGGPDKAICVYPSCHYSVWRRELDWPDLLLGGFGENFSVEGQAEDEVCIGDIYSISGALLQVSQPRQPCWKLARRWGIKDLPALFISTGRTGWYLRVMEEGRICSGNEIRLVERPLPQWTIGRANDIMHLQKNDLQNAAFLANCDFLSLNWRTTLTHRVNYLQK